MVSVLLYSCFLVDVVSDIDGINIWQSYIYSNPHCNLCIPGVSSNAQNNNQLLKSDQTVFYKSA